MQSEILLLIDHGFLKQQVVHSTQAITDLGTFFSPRAITEIEDSPTA